MLSLECDLQSEYGVDIRDLWRRGSGLSLRRLLALLKGLPPDSRFMKARFGMKPEEYDSKEQYLLHYLLDTMRQLTYFSQISAMTSVDKKQVRKIEKSRPKPLELPGEEEKKPERKFNTTSDLVRALGKKAKVVASNQRDD